MYPVLVGLWLAYATATGEAVGVVMAVLTTVRAFAPPLAAGAGAA